jgi:hypothetical protein
MSLLDVTSWACIVIGACCGALVLREMKMDRARDEITKRDARSSTGQKLCMSLVPLTAGVFILAGWWGHYWWLVSIFWAATAIWGLARPHRRRPRCGPDHATAEPS